MAELSYFWGGTSLGDAAQAPYDDDEFSDFIKNIIHYDNKYDGVLFNSITGFGGNLGITNPSGSTIRVATGIAVVDGKIYRNGANVDLSVGAAPGAGTDYYSVVLRKDFAAQTIRAAILGPVNGGPAPSPTQVDGTTWEIVLAEVRRVAAGTITILDKRASAKPGVFQTQLINNPDGNTTITIPSDARHVKILARCSGTGDYIWARVNGLSTGIYNHASHSILSSTGATAVVNAAADTKWVVHDPVGNPFIQGELELDIFQYKLEQPDSPSAVWRGTGSQYFAGGGNVGITVPITSLTFYDSNGNPLTLLKAIVYAWF